MIDRLLAQQLFIELIAINISPYFNAFCKEIAFSTKKNKNQYSTQYICELLLVFMHVVIWDKLDLSVMVKYLKRKYLTKLKTFFSIALYIFTLF